MSEVAIVMLLSVEEGVTHEAVQEFDTMDLALASLRRLLVDDPVAWRVVNIVHIEDLPAVMQGDHQGPT